MLLNDAPQSLEGSNQFDEVIDELISEALDEARRGKSRASDLLTSGQRNQIRQQALAAARRVSHNVSSGKSRKGRHQAGIARRARAMERAALRMIDNGESYETALAYLRRKIDRFDEFDNFEEMLESTRDVLEYALDELDELDDFLDNGVDYAFTTPFWNRARKLMDTARIIATLLRPPLFKGPDNLPPPPVLVTDTATVQDKTQRRGVQIGGSGGKK